MATSTFFANFKTGPGAKLEGYSGHIYLVPSGCAVNNLMPLTEDTGRPGQYFRENVPDGEYKVFMDLDKSGSPVESDLYKTSGGNAYLVWHGEKKQSLVANYHNDDGSPKATKVLSDLSNTPDYLGQIGILNGERFYANSLTDMPKWIRVDVNTFPLKNTASGGSSFSTFHVNEIHDAIIDIYLQGTKNPAKEYSIGILQRNVGGQWTVAIYDDDAYNTVAMFQTTSNPENGSSITVHTLSVFGGSGISGQVAIRWDKLTSGFNGYGHKPSLFPLQDEVWDKKNSRFLFWGISPTQLSNQTKALSALTDTPDYLGQTGSLNNEYYLAIALTGDTKWIKKSTPTFPFVKTAQGSGWGVQASLVVLRNFIKDLYLEGKYNSAKYYCLAAIQRNYSGQWTIALYEQNSGHSVSTLVAIFQTTTNPENGSNITIHDLAEYNGSGISGKIAVKWDELTAGSYTSMNEDNFALDVSVWDKSRANLLNSFIFGIDVNMFLPKKIYAALGRELNLYYDCMSDKADGDKSIIIVPYCSVGTDKDRGFRYIPDGTGPKDLTLKAINMRGDFIGQATTTLIPVAIPSNAGEKKILFLGDSMTAANTIVQTVKDLIVADNVMTPVLIGTQGSAPLLHEGHPGKDFAYFTGSSSPFYDSGALNFQTYMSNNGFTGPIDYCLIQLGTNDISQIWSYDYTNEIAYIIGKAKTLLNAILDVGTGYPSCKIILGLSPLIAPQSYGGVVKNREEMKRTMRKLWKEMLFQFDNGKFSANVKISPNGMTMDREHSFNTSTENASARNTTPITIVSDPIHPNTSGYQQMADVYYSTMLSFL